MPSNFLVSLDELKAATGCKRLGDLETILKTNKIPFFYGKGGTIFTTQTAIDTALGIYPTHQQIGTTAPKEAEIEIL
ncbi:hypothetical protein KFZ76_11985 [Methylovulum psychrotolerans]|uniref:hypothetical protein n=1 Tax=Methylovulum psychrotolerans TaxID=1704499 RepID=UPI001BFEED6E|nr:hypothetical protein [Methylovulum psychrotolerans]MBT9098427.1 hypothetical protein [Methylovulum psychrotolerans]